MGGHGKLVRRAAISALAVGLCTPAAASAVSRPRLPGPAKAPVVHLSERDANRTIHVSPGAHVMVKLHGSYDPPAVDHPEVLSETSHSGGYPAGSDARANFVALAPGDATISSRMDSACMHPAPGHARCMIMTAPLNIVVVVDAPAGERVMSPLITALHPTARRG